MQRRCLTGLSRLFATAIAMLTSFQATGLAAEPLAKGLFARPRLVAWCIVPFDSRKREPEERAAMLQKLGFTKFAYDYRPEHIPTFDAEIEALKRHQIELTAWWFPTSLNDEAKMTLQVFAKHKVTPQLWVTGGGEPTKTEADQRARVLAEADRIRPIAEAAARVGCKVALYNHGGWFGEPENQIAIIQELKLDNVGIVYNQHHGHDHLDRFPELLQKMKPHLYALNLNGMVKGGDRTGQKILPLGQGDLDVKLLKIIRDSGFQGPFGILGHTQDDAEARLQDNLDGLDWLIPQISGEAPGPRPKPRTFVPMAAAPQPGALPVDKALVPGRFGQALDGRAGGAFVAERNEFQTFPLTVECWTRLKDKSNYNILVAHQLKSSGTHWELFSMAGNGQFTAYLPGFLPDHCSSNSMICDDAWHHVAMVLEPARIRLYVDGKQVAEQKHQRTDRPTVAGGLSIASLVDQGIGCSGLVDEVRISKGIRSIDGLPAQKPEADESTIGLWRLDEIVESRKLPDASPNKNTAVLGGPAAAKPESSKGVSKGGKIEGHWGEDAIGFRWTESDSRDDRFGQVDSGPLFSGSITGAGGPVYKGIVVRVGKNREASVCYDTDLVRVAAGWIGFLKFDPARFGIIVPPRIDGDLVFATPRFPGASSGEHFENFRAAQPYGPLPKDIAHYEGLSRHGHRVVVKYRVGSTTILETPWLESSSSVSAITRTLVVGPASDPIRLALSDGNAQIRLHPASKGVSLRNQPEVGQVLLIESHKSPVTVKLLLAASGVNEAAFEQLVAASPPPENVSALTGPGPKLWGEPLVTQGELAKPAEVESSAYAVDTITLPFKNPFGALFFCGGHDFLPDGRAAVCTLHGDVWLVDGIDQSLEKITWRRFATGLFQPLGLKVVDGEIFITGRDQITRLRDLNGDGEADLYENFNNDAHVTLNGHEYVTCLETDQAGNFYYVKGNCNSQTPHDGSLLRVSPDGAKLDVFATGFRNPNGMGMGPNDEITVSPQEGEWTPASGVFLVHQGGFYGGMMSHHRPAPPTDFERPLVWFSRLADNSSGGQVWTTDARFGPLANQLLHMSYGQCRLRLVLRDRAAPNANAASIELPLRFDSGIHRGRMSPHDGQLYLTGLKGWTTSAVQDGCFQRVRYTGKPLTLPVALKSYQNGIELTYSSQLQREAAEEPENYRLEAWNYKWSAAYGSPEFKPSAPAQIGRDEWAARSATWTPDSQTVFLEIPALAPVDQLAVSTTQFSPSGQQLEQDIVLTLNSVSREFYPEQRLHRKLEELERAKLLASLVPGVILREEVHQKSTNLTTTSQTPLRMLAWDFSQSPLREVKNTTRTLTASGWMRVPSTGHYRFSAVRSPSRAFLKIGNQQQIELTEAAVELPLTRGLIPIAVTQVADSSTRPQFRLLWESHRIPREAIPPAILLRSLSIPADNQGPQTGSVLFAKFRCANCHATTQQELTSAAAGLAFLRPAPRLEGAGSRLRPEWIAEWVRDPGALRNDTTMPHLLDAGEIQTASNLAAYLATLKDSGQPPVKSQPPTIGDELTIRRGADLYEQLGCIGCHSLSVPREQDEWNRVSLHFVNAKYAPQGLLQYLLTPHSHFPASRMPDFHLSESEATALACFLGKEAKGELAATDRPAANAAQGRVAFQKLRCASCHAVEASGQLAAADVRPIQVTSSKTSAQLEEATGCLGTAPSGTSPRFPFANEERLALLQHCRSGSAGTALTNATPGSLDLWLTQLRCHTCHTRDTRASLLPEIVAEEGSGRPAESFPQLTWVGEKLQGPWIEKFLKGEIPQKPRPWLAGRMPSFPAYAGFVAHAMSAEHGVPFEEIRAESLDLASVQAGNRLTQRDGGLDCRQCHGIGQQQPRGDASTQIALGINFAMTRNRLRPEFALRQLLDPPRYDVGSRMPRFAPDLKTTAAKDIADGDAHRQFEMLKQFIWSVTDE